MKVTHSRLRLCTVLIVLNLAFIWGNSLLPAEFSQALSDWIKGLLMGNTVGDTGGTGSGMLRKLAHFLEFGMLGFLLAWLHGMLGKHPVRGAVPGFLAACVDEGIQCFVPQRGPGWKDVALDTMGVCTGMILCITVHTLIRKSRKS